MYTVAKVVAFQSSHPCGSLPGQNLWMEIAKKLVAVSLVRLVVSVKGSFAGKRVDTSCFWILVGHGDWKTGGNCGLVVRVFYFSCPL